LKLPNKIEEKIDPLTIINIPAKQRSTCGFQDIISVRLYDLDPERRIQKKIDPNKKSTNYPRPFQINII
jgi:hypothetical protein